MTTRAQIDPFLGVTAADLRHRLQLRAYGLYWRDLRLDLYPPVDQKHGEAVEIIDRKGVPWLKIWDGHYIPARPVIVCLRHRLDYIPRSALTTPDDITQTDFARPVPDTEAADRRAALAMQTPRPDRRTRKAPPPADPAPIRPMGRPTPLIQRRTRRTDDA